MADRADITPELCRKLLRYEPETGKLYWKPRPASMYRDSRCHGGVRTAQWAADCWNRKYAGREAFTAKNEGGYRVGTILGVMQRAHRVAWAIHYGEWPSHQIDHDDGNRSNYRILNLKAATNRENHLNEGLSSNNTSGFTGVCWCKQTGRWRAMIRVDGKTRHLGRFVSFDDAVAARRAANVRYGFHPNHGMRPAWEKAA